MSEQHWFYEQSGAQKGPVSPDAIQGMISSGVIQKESMIWRDGLADWTPYEKSELCGNSGGPPAIPGVEARTFVPREANLNPDFTFGIFESLGAGWNVMVKDFWPMVGFFALAYIILATASNLIIPAFFMTFPMFGGFMYYTLKRLRSQPGDLENIFDGFKRRFGSLAVLSFIATVPMVLLLLPIVGYAAYAEAQPEVLEANPIPAVGLLVGGFAIFFLASAIVGTIASLATLLCLDCNIGWGRAFAMAGKAYGKRFFKLTFLTVVVSILTLAGLMVFFVGYFVAGAWLIATYSYIYEQAFGDRDSV